jgi:hypothetical protein
VTPEFKWVAIEELTAAALQMSGNETVAGRW